jgi:flagellar basal-body rod protein FlgC
MSNGMFGAITTSGTGLHVFRTWMDAVAENVANMNDVVSTSKPAFQARFVVAQNNPVGSDGIGSGSSVAGIQYGDAQGMLVSDPTNPLADAHGLVRRPNIDVGDQLTQLMIAQRGYQANLAVVQRAQDAYKAALEIGK